MRGNIYADTRQGLIGAFVEDPERAGRLRLVDGFMKETREAGGRAMIFQHTNLVARSLVEAGFPEAADWAPFRHYWRPRLVEGEHEPMPHQLETAKFLTMHRRAYVLSTMRTGKTAAVVMALDWLEQSGDGPGLALIVCPVSVMHGVWGRTLWTMIPEAKTALLRGSASRRSQLMDSRPDYMIINYDGLKVVEEELRSMIRRGLITKVVIDELSNYGNPQAARYKTADRLFNSGSGVPWLWGLTGTPGADTQAVYGYCRMVNYAKMPWKSAGAWRSASQLKYGNEAWMWRDKPEAPRLIKDCMAPSIRFTKEEVLASLPPVTRSARRADLSAEQRKAYEAMRREMIVLFENGEVTEAAQKAALLSKLFQICLGSVITSQGGDFFLDNKWRLDALEALCRESERKSVIFCSFKAALRDMEAKLNGRGLKTIRVDGDVHGARRDEAFRAFQEDPSIRVLAAHPITTSYGTELAAADQLVYNGPMLSGVHVYMQGLERLSSVKQTSERIHVVEVSASDEEEAFFASLRGRRRQADAVASLFEAIVERRI